MYQGEITDVTGTCPIKNLNPAREANESHQQYKDRRLGNKRALYGYNRFDLNAKVTVRERGYRDGYVDTNKRQRWVVTN